MSFFLNVADVEKHLAYGFHLLQLLCINIYVYINRHAHIWAKSLQGHKLLSEGLHSLVVERVVIRKHSNVWVLSFWETLERPRFGQCCNIYIQDNISEHSEDQVTLDKQCTWESA